MQLVGRNAGALLTRLEDEDLADNTIVFFIGDHGRCHIRGKQILYDGGIRVPMTMRWLGKVAPGQMNSDMVMSIDICATALTAAGIKAPAPLHGQDLLGEPVKSRKYVFAARDKMDETHDSMRAIRSRNYKLIHNLMPERANCQYNRCKDGAYPVLAEMNILYMEGKLNAAQTAFVAEAKPEFELCDLRKDPHEINNLAELAEFVEVKAEMLKELTDWRHKTICDQGVSKTFRARHMFPKTFPVAKIDDWVEANKENYDFNTLGWPDWYPTGTLDEWKAAYCLTACRIPPSQP